jgi:hypothetical protein
MLGFYRKLKNNTRVATGKDSRLGSYYFEWGEDGVLVDHKIEVTPYDFSKELVPPPPPPVLDIPKKPPWWRRIWRGARGYIRVWLRIGLVDKKTEKKRLSLCQSCTPHAVKTGSWCSNRLKCSVCGCCTATKVKLKNSQCPLAEPRWLSVS